MTGVRWTNVRFGFAGGVTGRRSGGAAFTAAFAAGFGADFGTSFSAAFADFFAAAGVAFAATFGRATVFEDFTAGLACPDFAPFAPEVFASDGFAGAGSFADFNAVPRTTAVTFDFTATGAGFAALVAGGFFFTDTDFFGSFDEETAAFADGLAVPRDDAFAAVEVFGATLFTLETTDFDGCVLTAGFATAMVFLEADDA